MSQSQSQRRSKCGFITILNIWGRIFTFKTREQHLDCALSRTSKGPLAGSPVSAVFTPLSRSRWLFWCRTKCLPVCIWSEYIHPDAFRPNSEHNIFRPQKVHFCENWRKMIIATNGLKQSGGTLARVSEQRFSASVSLAIMRGTLLVRERQTHK